MNETIYAQPLTPPIERVLSAIGKRQGRRKRDNGVPKQHGLGLNIKHYFKERWEEI